MKQQPDTIEIYSFQRADGIEYDTYTTLDFKQAERRAEKLHLKLIANQYCWLGAEVVENHTKA